MKFLFVKSTSHELSLGVCSKLLKKIGINILIIVPYIVILQVVSRCLVSNLLLEALHLHFSIFIFLYVQVQIQL
jgi:hypothetical protein